MVRDFYGGKGGGTEEGIRHARTTWQSLVAERRAHATCRSSTLRVLMLVLLVQFSADLSTEAFVVVPAGRPQRQPSQLQQSSVSDDARNLLYQDQQAAMTRRAEDEEQLLEGRYQPLEEPKLSRGGFGGSGSNKASSKKKKGKQAAVRGGGSSSTVQQQAAVLEKGGVLRVNKAMSLQGVDRLREFVLQEQALAEAAVTADDEQAFFGVERNRKSRCDLQLSLLKGGFAADRTRGGTRAVDLADHPVADALQEVLGRSGTLRSLYEKLVTLDGEFYELAAVITDPGSLRQQIHPDLPFRSQAPLYVTFLALQDVTAAMGPTTFLPGTHTAAASRIFHGGSMELRDQQLQESEVRLATLNKGDAVVFDARVLHCGNANHDTTRAMFNFSFRNPQETGDLGYPGSMRPGYVQAMTLSSLSDALEAYEKQPDLDPFRQYGDGLLT